MNELYKYEDVIEVDGHYLFGMFEDGQADLVDDGTKECVKMAYPKFNELTQEQIFEIEEYIGRPIEAYYEIALKYGELV